MSYIVDPVSRIEGHLGIEVEVAGGKVTNAKATGNLWRGFENFMLGREINDAITFTQRICGVCPVPHGLTATYTADACLGYSEGHITFKDDGTYGVPLAAVMIRNMLAASDTIMSSLTHFYHLAAPSYVQGPNMAPWTPYFDDSYYHATLLSGDPLPATDNEDATDTDRTLWQAVIASYVKALAIRRKVFEANALYAGRQPMTSSYVAGGVTVNLATAQQDLPKYISLMNEVQAFMVREYVPIVLALGFLYPAFDNDDGADGYGAGLGKFLSWGSFPDADDNLRVKGGFINAKNVADPQNFTVANKAQVKSEFLAASGTGSVRANLTESIAHSWYDVADMDADAYDANEAAFPLDVKRTKPLREKADAYTFMKAPRWGGTAVEVGPMARMYVNGYFQHNTLLAATVPGYTAYCAPVGPATVLGSLDASALELGTVGINTAMIAPGIVNGLVNIDGDATAATAVCQYILELKAGLSIMDRLRGRALEGLIYTTHVLGDDSALDFNPANVVGFTETLAGITAGSPTYFSKLPTAAGSGWGAVEAARGALMHMANTNAKGEITTYQCIVPTTWNGSPVVGDDAVKANHGAIEAACIDTGFLAVAGTADTNAGLADAYNYVNDVEVLRVAQSFDPCIACAIH